MKEIEHNVTISQYSGTHFEVGKKLGERAKIVHGPNYVDNALAAIKGSFLYEALGMNFELSSEYIERTFPVIEEAIGRVHSDLLKEIQGFAAGLGESYSRALVFTSNFGNDRGCSQFFLNGYHARNYDDNPNSVENEFLLLHTTGSFISFGASTGYVERLDGINEKGLAVSLTFGAGKPPTQQGIGSAMFQRIVLDKASSVDEALDLFDKTPYVTPNNVLISDANGNSVVIEASAGKHRIRRGAKGSILVCANSYLHPDMRDQQIHKNPTTVWREARMKKFQDKLRNEDDIMDLLTTDFPNGLFEPYFTDGLGTLWSVIYHPESRGILLAIGEKNSGRKELRFSLSDTSTFDRLPLTLQTQLKDVVLAERLPQY